MMATRTLLTGLAVVAAAFIALLAARMANGSPERYATHVRPDGKFSLVIFRKRSWLPSMPGQGSDSPGEVQLLDGNQKILQRVDVDMVQHIENVEWMDKRVVIKLVADWPLPE